MAKYADFNDVTFLQDTEAASEWWENVEPEWKTILTQHADCTVEKPNFEKIAAITKLKCPNTNILNFNAIANLNNINSIVCYNCPLLTNAANLPYLTALVCNNCPQLISVTKLPSLTLLNCSNCDNLSNLSKLPSLTFLNFSNCKNLEKFSFLQNMLDLQTLNCSHSKHFISKDLQPVLNNALPLKELHCKGTRAISLTMKNKFRDKGCVVFD